MVGSTLEVAQIRDMQTLPNWQSRKATSSQRGGKASHMRMSAGRAGRNNFLCWLLGNTEMNLECRKQNKTYVTSEIEKLYGSHMLQIYFKF